MQRRIRKWSLVKQKCMVNSPEVKQKGLVNSPHPLTASDCQAVDSHADHGLWPGGEVQGAAGGRPRLNNRVITTIPEDLLEAP